MPRPNRLAALSTVLAALALGGCETTSERPGAGEGVPAIGLEGFVGVPAPAAQALADALVAAGPARRFRLVAASEAEARLLMRGHIAPRREAGDTAVAFVFDLFDRNGRLVRRVAGETRLPRAAAPRADDPWASVEGPGSRLLAERSAEEIGRALAPEPRPQAAAATQP